jgi:hypothetical protein
MCLAVYVASDHALPTLAYDPARPAFHVEDVTDYPVRTPLRAHFRQPFLYAVGPHSGCGCDFEFDCFYNDEGEYEARDQPEQVASRCALADFLSTALQRQAEVEVLTCCSGDESSPPKHRRRARPADFVLDRALFRFGELVVVSEQDTEPALATARPPE